MNKKYMFVSKLLEIAINSSVAIPAYESLPGKKGVIKEFPKNIAKDSKLVKYMSK
jgi:hypothetical protein